MNANRQLELENKKYGRKLECIWREGQPLPGDLPTHNNGRKRIAIWRSNGFLVVAHQESAGIIWLTVNRTLLDGKRWKDGITWDDLQRLKREAGYGDKDAVEVYPRDRDIVNVANMRHLFVFLDALVEFAWRNDES